jgi:hypothetical protein
VHFAGNLLLTRRPAWNLKLVNAGISGDTAADLKQRWQMVSGHDSSLSLGPRLDGATTARRDRSLTPAHPAKKKLHRPTFRRFSYRKD